MIEKLFDGYSIKARYFPALICLAPFLVAKVYIFDPWILGNTSFTWLASYLGGATVSCVLLYFLAEINRTAGKVIFENKKVFPTTQFLLSDSCESTEGYRNSISLKTEREFGLKLPSQTEQRNNIEQSRLQIGEIVHLIVNKVKNGHLVLKHNMEYGFFRNLAGGSLVALIVSLLLVVLSKWYFSNTQLLSIFLLVSLIYFVLMLIAWILLKYYGKEYSRILFREYLGS